MERLIVEYDGGLNSEIEDKIKKVRPPGMSKLSLDPRRRTGVTFGGRMPICLTSRAPRSSYVPVTSSATEDPCAIPWLAPTAEAAVSLIR